MCVDLDMQLIIQMPGFECAQISSPNLYSAPELNDVYTTPGALSTKPIASIACAVLVSFHCPTNHVFCNLLTTNACVFKCVAIHQAKAVYAFGISCGTMQCTAQIRMFHRCRFIVSFPFLAIKHRSESFTVPIRARKTNCQHFERKS
eukprot:TRINITY_DN67179_c0_g1_i1.p1 TRINITY_DN67179_c0_g1~~TRINITY_DN67179_c0_g1_i1.p1  ORF type:complete len:147 (-),score=9.80 TRINITY_DN67179_c0_g1_i1:58-498(-)